MSVKGPMEWAALGAFAGIGSLIVWGINHKLDVPKGYRWITWPFWWTILFLIVLKLVG